MEPQQRKVTRGVTALQLNWMNLNRHCLAPENGCQGCNGEDDINDEDDINGEDDSDDEDSSPSKEKDMSKRKESK